MRRQEGRKRLTINHLVPSNSSLAGFFTCNATGFLGFGGDLTPTRGVLVRALDHGGTRTRTRRNSHIPSQRWVLVCHLGRIHLLQSLSNVGALIDFSEDGGRPDWCRWSRWGRRTWWWGWGRRGRRRSRSRSTARGTARFEVRNRTTLCKRNEICNSLGGTTDLRIPYETHLMILGYVFCKLINQAEEGSDPFDVFRVPRLLVSFEALR
jgi:hypothetical protein